MEQAYCEAVCERKKSVTTTALKAVLIIVIVLLLLSSVIIPWIAIFGVAGAIALIWYWPRFNVTWEYVYCDGQIDFDQILGGEKRKTKLRIEIEDADVIAPYGSDRLGGYQQISTKDYSSLDAEAPKFVIVTKAPKDEGKVKIVFEPSDKMLDMMRTKCPHTFYAQ